MRVNQGCLRSGPVWFHFRVSFHVIPNHSKFGSLGAMVVFLVLPCGWMNSENWKLYQAGILISGLLLLPKLISAIIASGELGTKGKKNSVTCGFQFPCCFKLGLGFTNIIIWAIRLQLAAESIPFEIMCLKLWLNRWTDCDLFWIQTYSSISSKLTHVSQFFLFSF